MKKISIIIYINLLLFSCIDLITEEEYYESILLKGSGWFEFYQNNQNENLNLSEQFTFQIWFSGDSTATTYAPCIINLNDDSNNLAIYKNPSIETNLMIYSNSIFQEEKIDTLNLNNQNEFHLLSIVQDTSNVKVYINNILIFNQESTMTIDNIIVGGSLNTNNETENLWYGYIDEIRLWNTALTQNIITLHHEYKYKVSSSYDDVYLDYLIGLWDFRLNTIDETPVNIWQDINNHEFYTILYTVESMSNELSIVGR
tara:strand:- start:127 stop:897 length:771 start_codon:yes stop_codon:yes gene_type:complete